MAVVDGVSVIPDDLARVVDAEWLGNECGRGIVEGGVAREDGPAAAEEAVEGARGARKNNQGKSLPRTLHRC